MWYVSCSAVIHMIFNNSTLCSFNAFMWSPVASTKNLYKDTRRLRLMAWRKMWSMMTKNCCSGAWVSSSIRPNDSDVSRSSFTTNLKTSSRLERSTAIWSWPGTWHTTPMHQQQRHMLERLFSYNANRTLNPVTLLLAVSELVLFMIAPCDLPVHYYVFYAMQ